MNERKITIVSVVLLALVLVGGCTGKWKQQKATSSAPPALSESATATPIPFVQPVGLEKATPMPSPTPVAAASLATPTPTTSVEVLGVIVPLRAAVYGKPNGGISGHLRGGDIVQVLGRDSSGSWLYVSWNGGEKGWLRAGDVDPFGEVSSLPRKAGPAPAERRLSITHPKPSGEIYYTIDGGIYRLDLASSRVELVTRGIEPAVSSSGKWLAFARGGGEKGLWVRDLSSGKERRVFGGYDIRTPRWSPDDGRIYFSIQDETRQAQHVCVPFVGRCWDIPEDKRWHLALVSFPDGKFTGIPSDFHSFAPNPLADDNVLYQNEHGLAVTGLDRSPHQVLDKPWVLLPWVNPQGDKVAAEYRLHQQWAIALAGVDGSGFTVLTKPDPLAERKEDFVSPVWSPDGRFIALLHREEGTRWEILIVDLAGHVVRTFRPNPPPQNLFDGAQSLSWGN